MKYIYITNHMLVKYSPLQFTCITLCTAIIQVIHVLVRFEFEPRRIILYIIGIGNNIVSVSH